MTQKIALRLIMPSNECKGLPRPEVAPRCQDWVATSILSKGEVP